MAEQVVRFPDIPKNHYYEHYVSALISLSGRFVERGVVKREDEEVLELDIVTSSFSSNEIEKSIVEIKGGKKWGFPDIFKVRGWMDYLHLDQAHFVVQDTTEKNIDFKKGVAKDLNVTLLANVQTDKKHLDDHEIEDSFGKIEFDARPAALSNLRYAYCMEDMMLGELLRKEREDSIKKGYEGYQRLLQYVHVIHNVSFFESDPLNRILKIFQIFVDNKNITARIVNENEVFGFDSTSVDDELPNALFNSLFYNAASFSPLYISLHAELLNRLLILKSCVEYIILKNTQAEPETFLGHTLERLRSYRLPDNLRLGVDKLEKHPHFYLYPYFWQIYIYLFGGFILLCKKDEEYAILSSITGIPIDEIDQALAIFDLLFPLPEGEWHHEPGKHKQRLLKLFPMPLRGIGANFRRLVYSNDDEKSFEGLEKALSLPQGDYTYNEIVKWNNLAYNTLSMDKQLVHEKENDA